MIKFFDLFDYLHAPSLFVRENSARIFCGMCFCCIGKIDFSYTIKKIPFSTRYFFLFFTYNKFIMNQILSTKLESNPKIKEKKKWFTFQFTFSLLVLFVLIGSGFYYFYHLERKEDFSNSLIANYHIYKLYNASQNDSNQELSNQSTTSSNDLFGIIEIPKINLYYPVFSHLTEELLKISPCKFYGDSPDVNGNICIAGHNYDNALFFSKISSLSSQDRIHIFDNNGIEYVYFVTAIYEVEDSNLSPVLQYEQDKKILTLITCNNLNSNRIIVKAEQK